MLTHIDLFSGILGFALAAKWAGFKTVVFCEKDEFCKKVIKKQWPGAQIIDQIEEFNGRKYKGATLVTGGFPCQPFSSAGRKRGENDDRFLWPEMLRVVSEVGPDWVIAENVINIAHMVLARCENDLEAKGYEAQSFDIPACACGLSTMERHIWIVAARRSKFLEGSSERCISRKQRIFSRIRRTNNQSSKRFPPIPDLCRPILYRSRKGIPNFVDRHKALGNAIVPQVAYEIMKIIATIEEEK
jgi:DNA (cytosine-5)-methyltransferase 1